VSYTAMFDTVKMIIGILREKTPVPPTEDKIVVTLAELSTLWIKYNNSFEPAIQKPLPKLPIPPQIIEVPGETMAPAPVTGTREEAPLAPASVVPAAPLLRTLLSVEAVTNAFYDDAIEPYRQLLEHDGMGEGVNALVRILREDGDCSSIVLHGSDTEREEMPRVASVLSQISVRDHTFRTTRIALQLLRDRYEDEPIALIPVMLVAALVHDLGKIPRFRTGAYVKADHPLTSASIVESVFPEQLVKSYALSTALRAIKDHHQTGNRDQVALILRDADGKAREQEIAAADKTRRIIPIAEWFDVLEYMDRIARQVDVTQTGATWQAFSFGDTVYVEPGFLYTTAQEMALEKNVIGIELLRQTVVDKETTLKRILNVLRPLNVVSDELHGAYAIRYYEVQMEQAKKKLQLTPFKRSAFDDHGQFEERKKDHPPIVTGVKAL
jgi:hypothetical protein